MSDLANAQSTTLQAAKETTAGTLATSGWKELQVNPGGIGAWKPDVDRLRRNPLSKRRQLEPGSIVNLKVNPTVQHDLNKDLWDLFGDGAMLASGKHTGNTGLSSFTPTAVTATDYTVATLGNLTAGFIIRARGFLVAANNGIKVVGAASTGIAIKASGLAAETVAAPGTALVEVAGWRGAATDIGLDASGNLTSVAGVFTSWNVSVGQELFIGGDLGVAAENFANAAYRGVTKIRSITANLITFERRAWTVGAADPGTGKTITVWFYRYWRNVPSNHADSLSQPASVQPNFSLEAGLPGAGAAAATSYWYMVGDMINTFDIDAPAIGKTTATIGFVGRDAPIPTVTQATGAATSVAPIATSLFNTADHVQSIRVTNASDESALIVDIDSWKLTFKQNVSPQNQQGTLGAKRMVVGNFEAMVSMKGFVVQDDVPKAVRDSRIAQFGVLLRNADWAVYIDLPCIQLDDGTPDFPENGPVTLSTGLEASRDPFYNTTLGVSTFSYAPAA